MRATPRWLPRLTAGQLLAVGVICFLSVAAFVDVLTSIGSVGANSGPPQVQLGGSLGGSLMRVGHQAKLELDLYDAAGGNMDPACVGANLSPEFRVLKVTFLGTGGGAWRHNESCGGLLETNSTIPVVISVIPLHPGDYSIRALPEVNRKKVGSALQGLVRVDP